ncbi:hypothetical protein M0813_00544 [Anaeramoeba flamelloides]|uniref:Transposase n=1 Tax=Anaeramoeba flamelloides TaxID=1746091 RepID=A0ABQ8YB70_9EUKA|nr:hypothetical protein M0813_00544 [Anaeramoeba flamelloides]
MNLRGLYCKSIDHVEDRPKSEEDKQRDNTRFFQTYTHYIEENELTSDRIWCMDETPCQHSDTQKKSFKLRNSKSFSKTHGFNQRDTLVACIRADGARLAPMIIETRNAYLNKKDSSKSREKIGVIEKARKLFINLIFTPPKEAKRYSPLDNSFFGTFKRTRANCLPHMHNYTRILRLLIISKYYYDATGESVRGNFIKKWLGIMEERMYRKDRKTSFFRVCTDIQMNNMKTNSQKGKKRVRNAGKTTLSQPIFTEERFEVRPQSKKKTTPPKRKKKARNAGKTSLSQPIFTEDQLEERPQSKKKTTSPKRKKREKMLVMTRKKE